MPRREQEIMTGWQFALGDAKNFTPVYLPHDWAIDAPFARDMDEGGAQGFRDRWGIGWYRRALRLEEKRPGYRYYLDFGGIFECSTVWVNGREAGGHRYGYTPFRLDITKVVQAGDNQIEIRVDNTQRPADRWYSGCGIYRAVKLIEVEERHLNERDVVVLTELLEGHARVRVQTGMRAYVKATLEDGHTRLEAEGPEGAVALEVENPRLWSAETPNLYTLTLMLLENGREADRVSLRIGLRHSVLDQERGLLVNGERVLLKGVCVHQDVGCRGIAAKREIWRERLAALKEMGCNAIRPAHHIFSDEFLDLCDEMGFYVYEECFDKWRSGLYGRYFDEDWQSDVDAMVTRDRNRACVILWGVGNEVENQGQKTMLDILAMLVRRVKALDPTRPVTYAMNPHFKRESNIDARTVKDIQQFVDAEDDREIYDNDERIRRIAGIAKLVDVIACNYQEQWYPLIHAMCPDKLILGTEVYQFFRGHPDQMQNYTNENPALAPWALPYVIGSMLWTGYDYLGESMGYPAKGWSGAVLRTNMEKKPGFYLMQSYWADAPMAHFSVMDYSLMDEGVKEHWDLPIYADHWHFPQFHRTVIPYMIATNCDEVALYVNEKRYHVPKPADCPNRLITGFLPYIPGTVRVLGYRDGREVCRHETVTPGPAVKLGFDTPLRRAPAQEGYELLLTVRSQDEEGHPYFRESGLVRFRVEGDAEILAVDNGCLMGNEPYKADAIHMFRGVASVQIRLGGSPGRVAVSAYAEGLYAATAVITVEE